VGQGNEQREEEKEDAHGHWRVSAASQFR
jgi:hypothetical protein